MGKVIDITGQKFGRLIVIEFDPNKKINNKAYWICECDCGNRINVRGQDLRNGKTKSCGCLAKNQLTQKNLKDISNERFGKLIAIKRIGISKNHRGIWLCQCDYGNTCEVETTSLLTGNTKSCGCLNSYAEQLISSILKEHNIPFKQQYSFPQLVGENNHRLRFDFAILDNKGNLLSLIEFQGEQHFIPFKNDTKETFSRRKEYDKKKKDFCKNNKIKLIEITYEDRKNLNWDFLKQLL